jgi:hypothetical protein
MFSQLLIGTCTTQRYVVGAADTYGHLTKVWSDYLVDQPCRLSSSRGQQSRVGAEVVPVDEVLFMEDVDVTEQDRVVVDTVTYEILFVKHLQDSVTGHHLELALKRVIP